MTKKELRRLYKAQRNTLTDNQIDDQSLELANQVLKLPIWEYNYYHIFLSIAALKEINTEYILNILAGKDKNIVVSKTDFKAHDMSHFLLTDSTVLKVNSWGIPEPVEGIPIPEPMLQVVFVPLLAFDEHGHRVGYGKGFYDGFLAKCTPDTLKIGLSLFDPVASIADIHKDDIPLDYCVTPTNTYEF